MNAARPTVLLCVACALGCGRERAVAPFEQRDSAGVAVFTSREPAWNDDETWLLEPEPLLSVGHQAGDPARQFYLLTDGLLFGNGEFVVSNAGSGELRWFDAQGDLQRTAGRAGEGPGEFEWIESLHHLVDSVLAYDSRLGRATIFGPSGDFVRTFQVLVPPGLPARDLMVASGGELLAVSSGPSADSVGTSGKMVTTQAVYLRAGRDGAYSDTVATAPGHTLFLLGSSTGQPAGFRVPAFGLNEASATRDALFTRTQTPGELARFELDGTLSGLVRWPYGDLTLSPESVRIELIDWLGDEASAARYDLPVPSTRPAFGRVLVDDEGFLWVSEYAQYLRDPRVWNVFSPTLVFLGELRVPARFRILDVREGRILGRRLDDVDQELVEVRRLAR